MEAIKKKMQAMKVEKDNLMDRCDACEQVNTYYWLISTLKSNIQFNIEIYFSQSCRDAKLRREKTEEEVNELQNKSKTLEVTFIFTAVTKLSRTTRAPKPKYCSMSTMNNYWSPRSGVLLNRLVGKSR